MPQIGVPAEQVAPTGSQQQQPLQSVHAEVVAFAMQADAQFEADDPELLEPLELPEPLEPLPLPLLGPLGVLLLPQATSPTVVDAPATTSTWKSFSILMPET